MASGLNNLLGGIFKDLATCRNNIITIREYIMTQMTFLNVKCLCNNLRIRISRIKKKKQS